jgi:hypothetical protein
MHPGDGEHGRFDASTILMNPSFSQSFILSMQVLISVP